MLTHFSRGLGDLGIQEGLPAYGDTHLMELQRRGDRIYFVRKNHRFTAEPGTGMERSLEENVGHSVLAAWDIESRHDSTGNLLVEVTDFFVSDYACVGQALQGIYGGGPVRLDDGRSHVERVRGFPENVEIDAFLTYSAEGMPAFGGTVSVPEDARSLARLELSELSERLDAVLASDASLSRETRAHLAESKARIDRALEASLVVNGGDEG